MSSTTAENPQPGSTNKSFVGESARFSPANFRPPFLLRLASVFVDYIILLILPLTGLLSEKLVGSSGFGVFSDRTIWLFAIVFAGLNAVVLPIFIGQTIGKMLTGIRIVTIDGSPVGFGRVFMRQTFGYVLTLATLGLGFIISGVNGSGRALHDFLTGTVVVRASKRVVST